MNKKVRLGWIMEDPLKKPRVIQEKPAEEAKKPVDIRYYRGKYEVEFLGKTSQGFLCKALVPFTSGVLTVEMNAEFLANPRFLWKKQRKGDFGT